MVTKIGNPTLPNLKEDIMSKTINKWAKTHMEIINTFLSEYIEVNGVEEKELKNYLQLEQNQEGVFIKEDNKSILEITWSRINQTRFESEIKVELIMTTTLLDKEKYPKTNSLLTELDGQRNVC